MTILSLEQLLEIHALAMNETGDTPPGLRDLGRLEAAVASQTQHVFGEELYSSLFDKVAAIIRGIIADHPFINGNKRTAMLAGLVLLEMNGATFSAKPGEIENFAVLIATEHPDIPIISVWLEAHTKNI